MKIISPRLIALNDVQRLVGVFGNSITHRFRTTVKYGSSLYVDAYEALDYIRNRSRRPLGVRHKAENAILEALLVNGIPSPDDTERRAYDASPKTYDASPKSEAAGPETYDLHRSNYDASLKTQAASPKTYDAGPETSIAGPKTQAADPKTQAASPEIGALIQQIHSLQFRVTALEALFGEKS